MKVTDRAITFCLKGLSWRVISSHQEVISNIKNNLNEYCIEQNDYKFYCHL